MSTSPNSCFEEHRSAGSFDATVRRLSDAIEGAGLTLFASIDHAANARQVGLAMPPATVLIYGNAKGGTPVMLDTPQSALDLPLRVLIQERDGAVIVVFHPVAVALGQAGVSEELASRLEPAQRLLVEALG